MPSDCRLHTTLKRGFGSDNALKDVSRPHGGQDRFVFGGAT